VFRQRFFHWIRPIEHGFGWSRDVLLALTMNYFFPKTYFPTIPEERSDNDGEKKEGAHDNTGSRTLANATRGLGCGVDPGHTLCLTARVAISDEELNEKVIEREMLKGQTY
jgi:hypothetical protein